MVAQDCACCEGWELFPALCQNCRKLIHRTDEDWVRFSIMHQDRVGIGEVQCCSVMCALVLQAGYLESKRNADESNGIAYRGEGYTRMPGCDFRSHYDQIQALCDALGFAAQRLQSDEAEATENEYRIAGRLLSQRRIHDADEHASVAMSHSLRLQYFYGMFQGYRGLLRALEGNVGELHALEEQMLQRIDWNPEHTRFVTPGFEHVRLEDQVLPGSEHAEA